MSDICSMIGSNIRTLRKLRGLTLKQVGDIVNKEYGEVLSAALISAWQRGERRVSAQHLLMLSHALQCPVNSLFGVDSNIRLHVETLSQHERQIIQYLFTNWQGDTHALIEFVGMYMASDRQARSEMADGCLYVYNRQIKNGMKQIACYHVNVNYIREKLKMLKKKEPFA